MLPDTALLSLRDALTSDAKLVSMFREGFELAGTKGVRDVLGALLQGLGADHKLSIVLSGKDRERLANALSVNDYINVERAERFRRERAADVAGYQAEMRSFGLEDGS